MNAKILFLTSLSLLAFSPRATVAGQVVPAPPAAADLAGTWALDVHLSDDPEQVARALALDTGQFTREAPNRDGDATNDGEANREGAGRNRFGGFGRQGTPRAPARESLSPEDRKRLEDVTRAIRFAPPTLTISESGADVTITPGGAAAQTLRTDGKTSKQQFPAGAISRTVTWEGPQLVVSYDVGQVGKITYTYLPLPATRQLLIRVGVLRPSGQTGPFEIKLVYDQAPAAGAAG